MGPSTTDVSQLVPMLLSLALFIGVLVTIDRIRQHTKSTHEKLAETNALLKKLLEREK